MDEGKVKESRKKNTCANKIIKMSKFINIIEWIMISTTKNKKYSMSKWDGESTNLSITWSIKVQKNRLKLY